MSIVKYFKKAIPIEEIKHAVKKELSAPHERLRYREMNQKLPMEHDIKVPRDLVHTVMQELDDEDLKKRKPIVKKAQKRKFYF